MIVEPPIRDNRVGAEPRPLAAPVVDVRVGLFTVAGPCLCVAFLSSRGSSWLPRGFPDRREPLDGAARRIIRGATGLQEQYLEQLYTLNVTDEADRWTVVVSYLALISSEQTPAEMTGAAWGRIPIAVAVSEPDRMVIDYALLRLRAKLGYTNIAFHLLPPVFTFSELQGAYETILGSRIDKRNFRRRMIASGIVLATNEKRRDGSHRPAVLYRFQSERDPATYLTPPWADGS